MDMTTLALDTYKRVRYPGEQKNVYDIALNDFMKLLMRAKFGNNFSKVYSWTMNAGRCLHVEYQFIFHSRFNAAYRRAQRIPRKQSSLGSMYFCLWSTRSKEHTGFSSSRFTRLTSSPIFFIFVLAKFQDMHIFFTERNFLFLEIDLTVAGGFLLGTKAALPLYVDARIKLTHSQINFFFIAELSQRLWQRNLLPISEPVWR